MPPKVKITKEEIVEAALWIVRGNGAEALNARALAEKLNCSTQPIFSNFSSMQALQAAVVSAAEGIFEKHMNAEIAKGEYPTYKASGMAYISFAGEEKELFKLLYMRDRSIEDISAPNKLFEQMKELVSRNTGTSASDAELFHIEMWMSVHGLAVMAATGYLPLERNLISRMLTDIYQGLKKHYAEREEQ